MKIQNATRFGVMLVFGAAITGIVTSQLAYSQAHEGGESGFAALVGRTSIRPSDKRFQPAAAALMSQSDLGRGGRLEGGNFIDRYVLRDFFDRYLVSLPNSAARGAKMRTMTAGEALFIETLFSSDLKGARNAQITEDGFEGSLTPRETGLNAKELVAKAKALGVQKSQQYAKGAKDLGSGE